MSAVRQMTEREQRNHLSEMVRVAERKWNAEEDNASRLEEGRSILLSDMKNNLIENGHAKSNAQAEDIAKSSEQFKSYLRKMHDARRAANDAKADWRALERDYWSSVSAEASERAQMRMSRG